MNQVLHFGVHDGAVPIAEMALSSVLVLTGIASVTILGLALVALAQRRSRSYLLVTMALATLVGRTLVGALAMGSVIPIEAHHLIEHGFDGAMAVLLLAAVYYARTARPTPHRESA